METREKNGRKVYRGNDELRSKTAIFCLGFIAGAAAVYAFICLVLCR